MNIIIADPNDYKVLLRLCLLTQVSSKIVTELQLKCLSWWGAADSESRTLPPITGWLDCGEVPPCLELTSYLRDTQRKYLLPLFTRTPLTFEIMFHLYSISSFNHFLSVCLPDSSHFCLIISKAQHDRFSLWKTQGRMVRWAFEAWTSPFKSPFPKSWVMKGRTFTLLCGYLPLPTILLRHDPNLAPI